MSKGVMKIKPKTEPRRGTYDNLSILELMDHIANTTEELQEVMRRLDVLSEDTDALNQQVASAYRDYLEEKAGLDQHLKAVEEYVQRRKHLSTQLAGYSDTLTSRLD